MSSVSRESDEESEYQVSECPQLEYILEYVTNNKDFSLPSESVHHLLSLVCEEPSQPKVVPPYLLAAGCRAIFTRDLEKVFFEEAISALEQLDHLESIRARYVKALNASAATLKVDKLDRETHKMYLFSRLALRRWTLINEMSMEPFTPMNCLASINVLFPAARPDASKERLQATTLLQRVKLHHAREKNVHGCPQLMLYREALPYEKAHQALSRYLELTQSLIARIEDVIDPMPAELKRMGVKRDENILHRISRHLIATREDGYDPEETPMAKRKEGRKVNRKRKRNASPEI